MSKLPWSFHKVAKIKLMIRFQHTRCPRVTDHLFIEGVTGSFWQRGWKCFCKHSFTFFFNGTSVPTDGKQAPGCCLRPAKCRPGQWLQLSKPPVTCSTRPTKGFQKGHVLLDCVNCCFNTGSCVLATCFFYFFFYSSIWKELNQYIFGQSFSPLELSFFIKYIQPLICIQWSSLGGSGLNQFLDCFFESY